MIITTVLNLITIKVKPYFAGGKNHSGSSDMQIIALQVKCPRLLYQSACEFSVASWVQRG
jgi:hypothetical protein